MAKGKERIALGSGELYCIEYSGDTIPDDATIETGVNLLGLIQGGASVEYKPEYYTAEDDLGRAKKTIITKEEAMLKSGIMTWNGNTLGKLCSTARITEDTEKKIRIVKIGGIQNNDGKMYLIRFVNKDKTDGDSRLTIVGNNQAGFELAYAKDKETVINAEFKAMPMDKEGTLIMYTEEIA